MDGRPAAGYCLIMALFRFLGSGWNALDDAGNLEGYIDRLFWPGQILLLRVRRQRRLPEHDSIGRDGHAGRNPFLHFAGQAEPAFQRSGTARGRRGLPGAGRAWEPVFPIITLLWTSSYTLDSNGWCMLLFALFYWIIDVKGSGQWPFGFAGADRVLIALTMTLFRSCLISVHCRHFRRLGPGAPFRGCMPSWLWVLPSWRPSGCSSLSPFHRREDISQGVRAHPCAGFRLCGEHPTACGWRGSGYDGRQAGQPPYTRMRIESLVSF